MTTKVQPPAVAPDGATCDAGGSDWWPCCLQPGHAGDCGFVEMDHPDHPDRRAPQLPTLCRAISPMGGGLECALPAGHGADHRCGGVADDSTWAAQWPRQSDQRRPYHAVPVVQLLPDVYDRLAAVAQGTEWSTSALADAMWRSPGSATLTALHWWLGILVAYWSHQQMIEGMEGVIDWNDVRQRAQRAIGVTP